METSEVDFLPLHAHIGTQRERGGKKGEKEKEKEKWKKRRMRKNT